jgi:hypothetical protein
MTYNQIRSFKHPQHTLGSRAGALFLASRSQEDFRSSFHSLPASKDTLDSSDELLNRRYCVRMLQLYASFEGHLRYAR